MRRIRIADGSASTNIIPLIAHDLRTPVTAIKGLSQLALRRVDVPPAATPYLNAVVAEANLIASLIDDLVLVDRLDRGELPIRRVRLDLVELLRRVLDQPAALNVTTIPLLDESSESSAAWCDPTLTERAVVHLVRVAIKYCRFNDLAEIGATRAGDDAVIWIRTFDRDHRPPSAESLDDAKSDENRLDGVNLSVYLCAKLVEAQGGALSRDVDREGGFSTHLVLPGGSRLRTSKGGPESWS